MIDVNQLRRGVTFDHNGDLLKVTEYSHHKPGRGKATIRVNVRNLRSGANLQMTFNSSDRVDNVRLDKRVFQYLYDDGHFFVFMDNVTFEQKQIPHTVLGEDSLYLRDNMDLELLLHGSEVVDYLMPPNVEMEVIGAENAVAGDTASGATKEVTLSSGLKVKTPLFVNTGDTIRVDTRNGAYVTRV